MTSVTPSQACSLTVANHRNSICLSLRLIREFQNCVQRFPRGFSYLRFRETQSRLAGIDNFSQDVGVVLFQDTRIILRCYEEPQPMAISKRFLRVNQTLL